MSMIIKSDILSEFIIDDVISYALKEQYNNSHGWNPWKEKDTWTPTPPRFRQSRKRGGVGVIWRSIW